MLIINHILNLSYVKICVQEMPILRVHFPKSVLGGTAVRKGREYSSFKYSYFSIADMLDITKEMTHWMLQIASNNFALHSCSAYTKKGHPRFQNIGHKWFPLFLLGFLAQTVIWGGGCGRNQPQAHNIVNNELRCPLPELEASIRCIKIWRNFSRPNFGRWRGQHILD